ncbi:MULTISPECIES: biotin/lipoyl-containing protein [unclassified Bradyrhizobium]|uniref:biotin/lipoyl-containing protein n=1 Tax=unclassified Bradyrhizobium TaxID=2631580 RepID=UPI002304E812|nr:MULTISPECIES: biotin/lipoyl-containing protein [unclassified Bradyrhizobium]
MTKEILARLDGVLLKVSVKEGQVVKARDELYVVESVKSELFVRAPYDGKVERILRSPGTSVKGDDIVLVMKTT